MEMKYGQKVQFAEYDSLPPVGAEEQKCIQQVNGKFLWYWRAVDGMLLTPLHALTAQQAEPTTATMTCVKQFLDYCTTQEPAVLTKCKSDMVLAAHSDAGYLNKSNARS